MSDFENDVFIVWENSLFDLFDRINREAGGRLEFPNFDIVPGRPAAWGSWDSERRVIAVAERLFRDFEPAALERVLRHEMAHQMASERFGGGGKPHGEAFKRACAVLGVPPDATMGEAELATFKSAADNPVIDKIRKILAKGSCASVTQEEAAVFLKTANRLMVKYNVSRMDVDRRRRVFLTRPVGGPHLKTPSYIFKLCAILEKHYFTRHVRHTVKLWGAAGRKHGLAASHYKYIELFGEPANLDAAEYIFYSLLRQGERLWDLERRRGRQLAKAFKRAATEPALGKVGFLHGLFAGYEEQLDQRRRAMSGEEAEEFMALIKVESPVLEGEFRGRYPALRFRKVGGGSMAGYQDGFAKGLKLTIHPGLKGRGAGGGGLLPG